MLWPIALGTVGSLGPASGGGSSLRAAVIRAFARGPFTRTLGAISKIGHELPLDLSTLVKV